MNTYSPLPVTFARGEGARLWDPQGVEYLDALSGVAVCSLGHAHPAVADALCDQARTLVHTSNIYGIERQRELGDRLAELSGMDRVFFCNSGAEANEAAIKMARLYAHNKGISDPAIIVCENSFHGRTLATLSATGNRRVQAGFEPLVHGFVRAPYDDVEAMQVIARNNRNVVAVLVEPVQGEGGVRIPDAGYLAAIRKLCDDYGWLMMLDEVQTGMCRTGKWFGFQHSDVMPDVMTLAKALGNGVPIGACLARGAAADIFQPGNHATTFGGNPLASSAALAVIETMQSGKLDERAAELGARMLDRFCTELNGLEGVNDVRGKGLMIGIELDRPCGALVGKALERKLLINVTAERTVRLLPPLIINDQQADAIVDTVSELIREFLRD